MNDTSKLDHFVFANCHPGPGVDSADLNLGRGHCNLKKHISYVTKNKGSGKGGAKGAQAPPNVGTTKTNAQSRFASVALTVFWDLRA